jgi:transposase
MEHYIGIDAHCEYCDIAVMDERGVLVSHRSVRTGAQNLIEAVCKVKDTRVVIIEESTLAGWLRRTLGPFADHVEVVDPKRNALIARSENKSDRVDAQRLASLYRGGYTHPVHHTDDMKFLELKEMVLHYHDSSNQVTRFKNKLKAVYRLHGFFKMPQTIYHATEGREYIERLPFHSTRHRARSLLLIIASAEKVKDKAEQKLRRMSAKFPILEIFQAIPGVGPIVAVTVVAIVETPHRFPTKERLWKYACLAVARRESGGKTQSGHASKEGNRLLKKVLMLAAQSSAKTESRFGRRYRELRQTKGSSIAQRTVARMIMATMYGMWKTGECYRETG